MEAKMTRRDKDGIDKRPIIMIGIAAGLALLLLGNGAFGVFGKREEKIEVSAYDEAAYEAALVEKIEKICSKVKGAGEVSVAVTLDGSFKSVLVQNMQSNEGTSRTEYVLVGSGSSESAVTIGYTPPRILGVGIVCEGGESATVKKEIIALVSATFDLPSNKIYVTSS